MSRRRCNPLRVKRVHAFVDRIFGASVHDKRVQSLSDAVVGTLEAGVLGVHAIGRGLAAAKGLCDKHAIKQVDRLIGNERVDLATLSGPWISDVVGSCSELVVNLDWTEFDSDDHSMLVLSAQTSHGRSTPLMWKTVVKSELKGKRNGIEDELLLTFRNALPETVEKVTVVADRGFGDHKLYGFLRELGFHYVIRFRDGIAVASDDSEEAPAANWIGKNGRMRVLRDAFVTHERHPVPVVVCVQDKGMKDPWCLAASDSELSGMRIKKMYGKRFSCEETFRDVKDMHFGMGMSWSPIRKTGRRDRMLFIASLAIVLLTLLGAAGELAGLDRLLKANTTKKRTLSLFRQGRRWYELIPNMPSERLEILLEKFSPLVANLRTAQHTLLVA